MKGFSVEGSFFCVGKWLAMVNLDGNGKLGSWIYQDSNSHLLGHVFQIFLGFILSPFPVSVTFYIFWVWVANYVILHVVIYSLILLSNLILILWGYFASKSPPWHSKPNTIGSGTGSWMGSYILSMISHFALVQRSLLVLLGIYSFDLDLEHGGADLQLQLLRTLRWGGLDNTVRCHLLKNE